MRAPGIYEFDEADDQLSLLPMAARRALDCAGVHLSLKGWQKLALAARQALVRLGAAAEVDAERVRGLLTGVSEDVRSEPALQEPAVDAGPGQVLLDGLAAGHGLTPERWARLGALDRYVLQQLARRGKRERLGRAWSEISSGSAG